MILTMQFKAMTVLVAAARLDEREKLASYVIIESTIDHITVQTGMVYIQSWPKREN